MKYAALILIAVISCAHAAEAPLVDGRESEALMGTLKMQRNQQADIVAALNARISVLESDMSEMRKAAAQCKADDKK